MSPAKRVVVKVKRLIPEAKVPRYEHPGDSGVDLVASDYRLQPMEWFAVPTGIAAEVPESFELQVRPRSGLALNHGLTVLNTPGTVDTGYRDGRRAIAASVSTYGIRDSRYD